MADPRYPYWVQDMSPEYRGPTGAAVLRLAVLALLLVLAWQWVTTGGAAQARRSQEDRPATLCAEHAGRPGWAEVCARHGHPPTKPAVKVERGR